MGEGLGLIAPKVISKAGVVLLIPAGCWRTLSTAITPRTGWSLAIPLARHARSAKVIGLLIPSTSSGACSGQLSDTETKEAGRFTLRSHRSARATVLREESSRAGTKGRIGLRPRESVKLAGGRAILAPLT